jgi:FkbM family methyltransferase
MNLIIKLLRKLRSVYFPSKQQKIVAKFFNDGGEINLRYKYNLNENSIVVDLGGYQGQWASDIFSRYQSYIYIFEPVKSFYTYIEQRFKLNNKINVYNYGIGNSNRKESFSVSGDSSSLYSDSKNHETVNIIDFVSFLNVNSIKYIDLIKINIEGGEYEVLEALINSGYVVNIKNLQIQFHNVFPNAEERMLKIQNQLSKTHKLTYQYVFVWENWEIINDDK